LEEADLSRDLFKSDTCSVNFHEAGISLEPGTQGSMYTTVEGLFDQVIRHMEATNPFGHGDSENNKKFKVAMDKMRAMKDGELYPFHITLDDPLSNCFIYNAKAPEDDPQIIITVYERTHEQNEDLGFN